MEKDARILIVEDVDTDAELIQRELRAAQVPFTSQRVDNRDHFKRALDDFKPDIVLSDYNLPQFSGPEAFRLVKALGIPIPFILVTGSLTEEVAVECMKEGVQDYILKTSLKRLPSAVLNALEKKKTEQEKVKTEQALRHSEELYRLITENTSDLICMLDKEGNYEYVSPSHQVMLGYTAEELNGKNCFSLVHPDDCERVKKSVLDSLQLSREERVDLRFKHHDGEWRDFEGICNWITDEQEQPQRTIIVSRDLTDRKNSEKALKASEEQLRQSQKLEAIGQLAGGVAHDFNNLLTVITGYSDLLIRSLDQNDPSRPRINEIRKAAERATSLTRQLLAFSRKQMLQPKLFNLNTLVTDMGKMLRRLIGEDIELTISTTSENTEINADPSQIEQVLMNLVVNARDAMPNGGKIMIETATVNIDKTYSSTHFAAQPGLYVMLAVSDTGCGMDAETQKHIFEPFFTTKDAGKGTGLGLSTTYGIIKQSGGNIWVYSEPSHGTTFKVYLPRATQTAHEEQLVEESKVINGNETLLLVEDEPQIRQMAYEFLTECGYKVLVASNGLEALSILEGYKDTVHLILTDLVMPHLNGRELADRVAELRPGTRVLFMSGYTNDAIVRHRVLDSSTWFIEKPFSPEALARKIREVLENEKPSRKLQEVVALTE
jgi:PAS domain S-box-containing protein